MKPLMNQGEPIVCLKTIRQLIQCEGKIKVLSDFPIVNQNKSKWGISIKIVYIKKIKSDKNFIENERIYHG